MQTNVVDDVPEAEEADVASPNASVKVAVRVERSLGIVDVEGHQVLKANNLVEFGHGCSVGSGSADVVAGGEDVAGVHTDADTVLVHDELGTMLDNDRMRHWVTD